ncbi:MAG: hypothetical protein JETT_3379 [Candidatus Jettenia ecosi]|uniref:Uncharacterized protein n=1 Tax=Candidatus Jettenia ecosi TaxID=2494326 RepID=A0A533Q6U5_9BACT|nr:MAG: hypothetical protein JETT_3379 [Candidatus Jettenia ecosi]
MGIFSIQSLKSGTINSRKLTLYGDSIFTLLFLSLREALELDFIEIFFRGLWRIMISNRLKTKKSQRVER